MISPAPATGSAPRLVIVSGLSGAGKSIALHALEDAGYYAIDNIPLALIPAFADQLTQSTEHSLNPAAVAIDVRNARGDLRRFPALLQELRTQGIECTVLFLYADRATLIKRFSETRRRHPLTSSETSLEDAIAKEQQLLEPLRGNSDWAIDTCHLNVHQLRDLINERVLQHEAGTLSILIQSFGFKHGVPSDADFVFDLRCLPNPHWEPELRRLTGRDGAVIRFLEAQPAARELGEDIAAFLERWLPEFERENRSYLTVALGCTGGQHRSVYFAEWLAERLAAPGRRLLTRHREII